MVQLRVKIWSFLKGLHSPKWRNTVWVTFRYRDWYSSHVQTICVVKLKLHHKAHLHWQKPKSKKPGFFVVPFTLPEKPITFGVFGTKSACAKNPRISYWCFGKWCACATSLYLWPYTCSAHYVAGRGRVIPLKVTYHVTKNPNNTGEIGASVYIGKTPVKFRRSFKKSRCGGGFFDSFFFYSV